ncbi:MAG: molybdopterin-dependent oxidoreductase [Ktedonobacteraceae bacterium]
MKTTIKTKKLRRQPFRVGLTAGLLAGVIATGVMLLLSVAFNGISLPEVFGSELTALMPVSMFDYLHQTIGGDAKHYLFYGILVGQCLVFAVSGGLYALVLHKIAAQRNREPGSGQMPTYNGVLLALILWLLSGLVLLPLTGGGVFGATLSVGMISTMLSLGIVGIVFGGVFVYSYNWLASRLSAVENATGSNEEKVIARRRVLQRGFVLAGAVLLGVGAWRFITQGMDTVTVPVARLTQNFKSKIVPAPTPNYGTVYPAPNLSPEITSNDQYYIVSKNLFADPTVDAGPWRLTVDGAVDHPMTLTYQDLLSQPMQQQYESMMCVSNEVGGPYMSNALWEGVRLQDLLTQAGVKAGAVKVVFYAVDDYSDSITPEKAMEPTTLIAVRMNGVTLPQGHGFPARMLVPGIYGMKHCKWLTRIEVVDQDYQGYWQQRGWSDPAPVRLTSRIDTPFTGSSISANQVTYIAGVAFSGNKGISEVDVSLDAGQTWQRATLKQPRSNLTWVLWELPWRPKAAGDYTVVVRAVDLEGNVQDPNEAPPAPNGSSGYHAIDLSVS